jgi:hypothetical protein
MSVSLIQVQFENDISGHEETTCISDLPNNSRRDIENKV